jgi:hypothetical protein
VLEPGLAAPAPLLGVLGLAAPVLGVLLLGALLLGMGEVPPPAAAPPLCLK